MNEQMIVRVTVTEADIHTMNLKNESVYVAIQMGMDLKTGKRQKAKKTSLVKKSDQLVWDDVLVFGVTDAVVMFTVSVYIDNLVSDRLIGSCDIPFAMVNEEIFDIFTLVDNRFETEEVKGSIGLDIRLFRNPKYALLNEDMKREYRNVVRIFDIGEHLGRTYICHDDKNTLGRIYITDHWILWYSISGPTLSTYSVQLKNVSYVHKKNGGITIKDTNQLTKKFESFGIGKRDKCFKYIAERIEKFETNEKAKIQKRRNSEKLESKNEKYSLPERRSSLLNIANRNVKQLEVGHNEKTLDMNYSEDMSSGSYEKQKKSRSLPTLDRVVDERYYAESTTETWSDQQDDVQCYSQPSVNAHYKTKRILPDFDEKKMKSQLGQAVHVKKLKRTTLLRKHPLHHPLKPFEEEYVLDFIKYFWREGYFLSTVGVVFFLMSLLYIFGVFESPLHYLIYIGIGYAFSITSLNPVVIYLSLHISQILLHTLGKEVNEENAVLGTHALPMLLIPIVNYITFLFFQFLFPLFEVYSTHGLFIFVILTSLYIFTRKERSQTQSDFYTKN